MKSNRQLTKKDIVKLLKSCALNCLLIYIKNHMFAQQNGRKSIIGSQFVQASQNEHPLKVPDFIGFRTGKYNLTQMKNNSKFQRF